MEQPYGGGANNAGTIFKITPGGDFTLLYSFCSLTNRADGQHPTAGLVQATEGNFYGTTEQGGSNPNGYGTVFEFTLRDSLQRPHFRSGGCDHDHPRQ
jgi:uncharacterized repeat protein (TIGR03803 family)